MTLTREIPETGLFKITMKDLARRNALSDSMMDQLADALDEAAKNPTTRPNKTNTQRLVIMVV